MFNRHPDAIKFENRRNEEKTRKRIWNEIESKDYSHLQHPDAIRFAKQRDEQAALTTSSQSFTSQSSTAQAEKILKKSRQSEHENSLINNFQQGDLIFGLSNYARDSHIKILTVKNYRYTYANTLNTPAVKFAIGKPSKKELEQLRTRQYEHYETLLQHIDFLKKPGGKPSLNGSIGIAYRRACKLLIRLANANGRVHFELDHIDMERICKKKPGDLGITNSELRAAFRNEQNGKPNPHVFFYQHGHACVAPWKDPKHQKLWEEYDTERKNKIR